jgi:hypothetical protein
VGADGRGQMVVDRDLEGDGLGGRQVLQARRAQRQDLDVEAGLVHLGEPLAVQVGQAARRAEVTLEKARSAEQKDLTGKAIANGSKSSLPGGRTAPGQPAGTYAPTSPERSTVTEPAFDTGRACGPAALASQRARHLAGCPGGQRGNRALEEAPGRDGGRRRTAARQVPGTALPARALDGAGPAARPGAAVWRRRPHGPCHYNRDQVPSAGPWPRGRHSVAAEPACQGRRSEGGT